MDKKIINTVARVLMHHKVSNGTLIQDLMKAGIKEGTTLYEEMYKLCEVIEIELQKTYTIEVKNDK